MATTKDVGFVRCADCGQNVALYYDGDTIRVVYHDNADRAPCGMGGQKVSVLVAARRAALGERREVIR